MLSPALRACIQMHCTRPYLAGEVSLQAWKHSAHMRMSLAQGSSPHHRYHSCWQGRPWTQSLRHRVCSSSCQLTGCVQPDKRCMLCRPQAHSQHSQKSPCKALCRHLRESAQSACSCDMFPSLRPHATAAAVVGQGCLVGQKRGQRTSPHSTVLVHCSPGAPAPRTRETSSATVVQERRACE